MKLDPMNKWLSLAANFGVVIGIFVLVWEVRQNQEILEQNHQMNLLTARTADIQQYHEWRAMLIQDPELYQIYMDGVDDKELSEVDHGRFMLMCLTTLWADASMYERAVSLGRTDTTARTIAVDMYDRIQEQPGYKKCWSRTRRAIRDYGFGDFVEAVDTRVGSAN